MNLARNIQSASIWFIGVFIEEFLHNYDKWHNTDGGKMEYARYFHAEYGENLGYKFSSSKTKCYALMAIIEHHKVLDALEIVFNSNDKKVEPEAYKNASALLNKICIDEIILP